MKVIIDLIEDIRESIANNENYTISAMLLKEDSSNEDKLTYHGEVSVGSFYIDEIAKELIFSVEQESVPLSIGELVKHLLILDMSYMMYEIKLSVSEAHLPQPLVGFGVNTFDAKYALFIMA